MVVGRANILPHRLPVSVQRAVRGVPGGEEMRKTSVKKRTIPTQVLLYKVFMIAVGVQDTAPVYE